MKINRKTKARKVQPIIIVRRQVMGCVVKVIINPHAETILVDVPEPLKRHVRTIQYQYIDPYRKGTTVHVRLFGDLLHVDFN